MKSTTEVAAPARLAARGLTKTYGAFRALSDVAFDVRPGELHALMGQNGSGKSTLIKILTGYHAPDPGAALEADGVAVRLPIDAAERRRHGISVVHQSLGLVLDGTVTENVRVEQHRASRWLRRVDWAHEREATAVALERLGSRIHPDARIVDLSAEDRATVAIARATQNHRAGQGLIVFDESTRPLTRDALDRFYHLLQGLLGTGTSVLMISHRLEEVMRHSDRVSVLRDGRLVMSGRTTDALSESEVITAMLGHELERAPRDGRVTPSDTGVRRPAVVRALTGGGVEHLSFEVAPGEVLGLTGLIGSGFEDVPYLLAGARPAERGELEIDGAVHDVAASSLGAMIGRGVVLVPEDRAERGLCLDLTVEQNITAPRVRDRGRPWWTGAAWRAEELRRMVEELDIRPPRGDVVTGTLSGGNQQKVLLAKWLAADPTLLLLHEPTQAVDVGARERIVRAVVALARRGSAVVVAATDPGELAAMCDRVLVIGSGGVVAELRGDLDPGEIVHATFAESRAARASRRPTRTPQAAHR